MAFWKALELLINSSNVKLSRKSWKNKDVFIYYVPAAKYKRCTNAASSIADENNMVQYGSYIAIHASDGNVYPFTPGMDSMLANDWEEV